MESGVLRVTLSNNGAAQPIIERKGETATLLMSQKRHLLKQSDYYRFVS
jgi:hypothetical protein